MYVFIAIDLRDWAICRLPNSQCFRTIYVTYLYPLKFLFITSFRSCSLHRHRLGIVPGVTPLHLLDSSSPRSSFLLHISVRSARHQFTTVPINLCCAPIPKPFAEPYDSRR